jgi:biopolymer transport protein ExbD
MNRNDLFPPPATQARSAGSFNWIEGLAPRMIQLAARGAPQALAARLKEEWLADLSERRGQMSRLSFALGCYWALVEISRDHCPIIIAAPASATTGSTLAGFAYRGPSIFSRRATSVAPAAVLCDINTTPLIDVMLVLLVTLIVTLPIMTNAVKVDLPQPSPPTKSTRPEVINLDIDFDGTLLWNGRTVANMTQLESYFRTEARKSPQPEVRLHPDSRVKYDFVAQVLSSAQHNRMQKIGFVNTGDFTD